MTDLWKKDPVMQDVLAGRETAWVNPYLLPFHMVDGLSQLTVGDGDIADAEARLARFAPFIRKRFPETEVTDGLIESPLQEIEGMRQALIERYGCEIPGKLLLKMDSHLAIAGSVKARGGIYEVLKHAEDLAEQNGLISRSDNYEKFAEPEMREFFGRYTVQVGSTGNLGMSIGIMSAALGFRVKVHMSADAKQWKKELLRSHGVEVIEYADDYSRAVAEGRRLSDTDPTSYFVDDEKSKDLFLGYAVAAGRLRQQLAEQGIVVDKEHPLIVYIPAGVGGAPGGVSYGLKRLYGDLVHCFFVEPTLYPSVLMGIATQKFEQANVHDYGLHGLTAADGLACASPSSLVTRLMTNHLAGEFTVEDGKLYDYMRLLYASEQIKVEPSGCAAFAGPCGLLAYENSREYCEAHRLTESRLANATHIAWVTGGRMVPEAVMEEYLNTYLSKKND
ncbi:MAG: D-serine ammonia-lyase [Clostridia bacterium]|nr:D-serine ammonia-lyase [Clostridia bacterium]